MTHMFQEKSRKKKKRRGRGMKRKRRGNSPRILNKKMKGAKMTMTTSLLRKGLF